MSKSNRSRGMIVLSMAIFGTLAPFVRNIPVSSAELALYRAVLALLMIGLVFAITGQKISLRAHRRELPLLLFSGMAMGVNWILLFEAYRYTTVAVATLSYYFAPVLVTVICPVLFKEKLSGKQIICFVMSTVGLALVIGVTNLGKGSQDLIGVLFGLGAAVLYATVVLINKFIKGIAGLQRTFLQFVAAVVILLPYVLCTGGVTLGGMQTTGWICLLVVGVIHTGTAYVLYFSALKEISGQEASILSYVDPLVAVLVSVIVLGEPLTLPQLLGGALILGFTLWNEIQPKKKS